MMLVYSEGCVSTGWKEYPTDKTPSEIITEMVADLSDDERWDLLKEAVKLFGEYSDGDYCEQCGDTYYEITFDTKAEK